MSPVVAQLGPGQVLRRRRRRPAAPTSPIAGLRACSTPTGYQVLQDGETGDPTGRAWTELGDIDELGHKQQAKLPALLDGEVGRCASASRAARRGWRQVVVVTDHGWLYLPGGLPKVELPVLPDQGRRGRKGRTARLADGAVAPGGTVPWFWDPDVRMAVAPGIAAFVGGRGLRARRRQPAGVRHAGGHRPRRGRPRRAGRASTSAGAAAGATCRVGGRAGGSRRRPPAQGRRSGDDAARRRREPLDETGRRRILVADEDAIGTPAFVVVLDADGRVLAQDADDDRRRRLMELDALDRLAAEAFPGSIVRKDLALKFKGQYPVPTYVGEFLLGRYCASTDEEEIDEGLADRRAAAAGPDGARRRGGAVQVAGARAGHGQAHRPRHGAPGRRRPTPTSRRCRASSSRTCASATTWSATTSGC